MKEKLTKNVKYILDKLNNNGYLAYVVGGAVRDAIMGKIPDDFDITTSAKPDEIIKVFSGEIASTNGLKHGTVGIKYDNEYFEITTFRKESTYNDNRHPDEVSFVTDYYEDAKRRDFTINAIAYDHVNDKYLDYFDGVSDIKKKIIRCVGNPVERFNEDALRIIRAVRFSSVLGFEIEPETENAMFLKEELLKCVTIQRMNVEIVKSFNGKFLPLTFKKYFSIFQHGLPHISLENFNFMVLKPFSEKIIFNLVDNLSLIFSEEASKKDIYKLLLKKAFSKTICKKVYDVCKIINQELNDELWREAFVEYPADVIISADKCAKANGYYTLDKESFDHYLTCSKRTDLLINGNEMLEVVHDKYKLNYYTKRLIIAVMNKEISNNKHELLTYLKRIIASKNC